MKRTILGGPPKGLFSTIEVEISTPCNLRCSTCPNSTHSRKPGVLPDETFRDLVDQLAAARFQGSFSPHFYNEPLLDARLEEFLGLVRAKLPKATIPLFTNFTLMTPERYRALAPLVDEFVVTLGQPEVDEAVQALRGELAPGEQGKLRTRSLGPGSLTNRAGAVELSEPVEPSSKTCDMVLSYMTVDAHGDVHLCCNDYFGKATFGNVKEERLLDIWFSDKYQAARRAAYTKQHPLCRGCIW